MVLVDSHGISRVPRYSGAYPPSRFDFAYRTVTFYGSTFQRTSTNDPVVDSPALRPSRPYNPREQAPWFGLFRVRSPLLAESLLFSLPAGTEMVHFPALPSHRLCIQRRMLRYYPKRVSPFGNPRVKACLQLTEAYRSLPRPSSTSSAKAFTVRS